MRVDDGAGLAMADGGHEERRALRRTQRRIGGTADDRAVDREREHLLRRHPLLLHAARRDDDVLAFANADPAAGPGSPAEAVELAAEVADEARGRHGRRILDLPADHGLIEGDHALASRGDRLAAPLR